LGAPGPGREQPVPSGGPRWRVAAFSFVVLGLALALARQIPGEVGVVSGLRNLVPMASLFGLGLGCVLQNRRPLGGLLPGGLLFVFVFVFLGRGVLADQVPPEVLLLLENQPLGPTLRLPLLPAALAAFAGPVLLFVALGQSLARAMDQHPRLVAFGWALAGGLVGMGLHVLALLLSLPPWAEGAAVITLAALVLTGGRWQRASLLTAGLAFLLFAHSPLLGQWSPYALVQHISTPGGSAVFTNSTFRELIPDIAAEGASSRRARTAALAGSVGLHRLFREIHGRGPESVLVLGATTGNDVAVALDQGVSRVVAMEIDPVLLELGRDLNPAVPYADPRVDAVVGDPRHHLRSSRETFDLVIFANLDSPLVLPEHAVLPRRSFVFTREAFGDARERLAEGGLLAVERPACPDELPARLADTLRSVFDDRCRMIVESEGASCQTTLVASRELEALRDSPATEALPGGGLSATDDWPYVDLEGPAFTPIHLRLLGAMTVLVLGVLLLIHRVHPVVGLDVDYLLLGMGSTLMGSVALVRLALLFGDTWVVHAVVASSALLAVLLANTLVLHGRAPSWSLAWGGLGLALVANALVPLSSLLTVGIPGRVLATALLVGLPVFCAASWFSRLFESEVVLGYVSMATGMRALWLLALAVYALAWLSTRLIERSPA
jgi:hypothetical protein